MFTGIIESIGLIKAIQKQGENFHYTVTSDISKELKIDQSVAHNGVCLTITSCNNLDHKVTAIKETIQKTNMSHWKIGQIINLERCLKIGDRLDGHVGKNINPRLIVDKGSICINGVSLTVVKVAKDFLEVAIIPYTYENTNFKELKVNNLVNIEYDILGKYILKNINQ